MKTKPAARTSQFHETSKPPVAQTILFDSIESPVGRLVVGATQDAVCLLEFFDRKSLDDQVSRMRRRFDAQLQPGSNHWLRELERQINQYFAGVRREFELPLSFPGTPFQSSVWDALIRIPYGATCSYQDIAREVGNPKAVRAVGTANGNNPIAIVIPCHRVINSGGQLGGYGGGLVRKRQLLALECAQKSLLQ